MFNGVLAHLLSFFLADVRISAQSEREYRAGAEQSGIAATSADIVSAIRKAMRPAISPDSCQGPVCSLVESHAVPIREKRAAGISAIGYGLISFALALDAKGADCCQWGFRFHAACLTVYCSLPG